MTVILFSFLAFVVIKIYYDQYLLQIDGNWYSPTPGFCLYCRVKSNLLALLIPYSLCPFTILLGEKSDDFSGSM